MENHLSGWWILTAATPCEEITKGFLLMLEILGFGGLFFHLGYSVINSNE